MKALSELTEREVLALAIANEEEDSRIYQSFADRVRAEFPASAAGFDEIAGGERGHRASPVGGSPTAARPGPAPNSPLPRPFSTKWRTKSAAIAPPCTTSTACALASTCR